MILPHIVQESSNLLAHRLRNNKHIWPLKKLCLDCSDFELDNLWIPPLLLLFEETKTPQLCKYLEPLFLIATILERDLMTFHFEFKLGRNIEALLALKYYIDCQIKTPEYNALKKMTSVSIDFTNVTKRTIDISQHLLHCMIKIRDLQVHFQGKETFNLSYDIRCMHKMIKDPLSNPSFELNELVTSDNHQPFMAPTYIEEIEENICLNLGKLHSLKRLLPTGSLDNLNIDCTGGNAPRNLNVTDLTHRNATFKINMMKKFFEHLPKLTTLSMLGSAKNKTAKVINNLLLPLASQNMEKLVITNHRISANSIRPLLSTLKVLHLESLDNTECNELFNTLFKVGKMKLRDFKRKRSSTPLTCRHLRLNCTSEEITTGVVRLLAKAFRYLPRLTILNLRRAQLTEGGLKLIATALRSLTNLKEINLSKNMIVDASEDICKSLSTVPELENVLLRETYLNEKGISELGKSLHHLQSVTILNITRNFVDVAMSDLCAGIQMLSCLQELNLNNCELTDECVAMLPFKCLATLTHLYLGGVYSAQQCTIFILRGDREIEWRGRNQSYTPKGVRTMLDNLHYLRNLTCLQLLNHEVQKCTFLTFLGESEEEPGEEWKENESFLKTCYNHCLPEDIYPSRRATLSITKREHIDAIIAFINAQE